MNLNQTPNCLVFFGVCHKVFQPLSENRVDPFANEDYTADIPFFHKTHLPSNSKKLLA